MGLLRVKHTWPVVAPVSSLKEGPLSPRKTRVVMEGVELQPAFRFRLGITNRKTESDK